MITNVDNMVLDPTDITRIKAVLDWEMCTLGDPLTDLGTALAYWIDPDDPPEMQMVRWGPTIVPGMLRRAELAQRYAEKTGRDLSDIVFYYVFAMFKVAVIIQQIYYRYFHGMTKDERFASLGEVAKTLMRVGLNATREQDCNSFEIPSAGAFEGQDPYNLLSAFAKQIQFIITLGFIRK